MITVTSGYHQTKLYLLGELIAHQGYEEQYFYCQSCHTSACSAVHIYTLFGGLHVDTRTCNAIVHQSSSINPAYFL